MGFRFREGAQANWLCRYVPLKDLLDARAANSLLEVGSGAEGLGCFIDSPFVGLEVAFAAPPVPPMTGFAYDGRAIPFEDRAFDTVVSTDVFEHVPPEHRPQFLEEILRVASRRVIIAFPAGPEGDAADALFASVVEKLGDGTPGWLSEHDALGLPDGDVFATVAGAMPGWRASEVPTTSSVVAALLTLVDVVPELAAWATPRLDEASLTRLIAAGEGGPSYRRCFVFEREQPSQAHVETASLASVLSAARCPTCCRPLRLTEPPPAAACDGCNRKFARSEDGVWDFVAPKQPRDGRQLTTFVVDPDLFGDRSWVGVVHNFLHAFEADAPVRLWIDVDPRQVAPEVTVSLLSPLFAPFGEAPFAELYLPTDEAERPPTMSVRIDLAEANTWTTTRFRAEVGRGPTRARPLPAEVKVQRAKRAKALHTAVELEQARHALVAARMESQDLWSGEPLVSVRISTFNRPKELVERALASALRQTYPHVEVVVVGDHAVPETARAIEALGDPRVRYHNLPARPRYANFPRFFWQTAGTHAVNHAFSMCRGRWIAPLDDDDTFTDDHVEQLLNAAKAGKFEFVHSQMEVDANGTWMPLGKAPLTRDWVCHGSVFYASYLTRFQCDAWSWLDGNPGDWSLWSRMQAAGVRMGYLGRVTGRHYPEYSAVDPAERQRLFQRVPTPEEVLADLDWTGGQHLLAME